MVKSPLVKGATRAGMLHIRPSPRLREALRAAAEASGRTLNKEIERRLEASLQNDTAQQHAALYEGWSIEDAARFQSLADVTGLLCESITATIGIDHPKLARANNFIFSALRTALSELLDRLGMVQIDALTKQFAIMIARQTFAEMQQAAAVEKPTGKRAALAAFAKAWGIQGKASP